MSALLSYINWVDYAGVTATCTGTPIPGHEPANVLQSGTHRTWIAPDDGSGYSTLTIQFSGVTTPDDRMGRVLSLAAPPDTGILGTPVVTIKRNSDSATLWTRTLSINAAARGIPSRGYYEINPSLIFLSSSIRLEIRLLQGRELGRVFLGPALDISSWLQGGWSVRVVSREPQQTTSGVSLTDPRDFPTWSRIPAFRRKVLRFSLAGIPESEALAGPIHPAGVPYLSNMSLMDMAFVAGRSEEVVTMLRGTTATTQPEVNEMQVASCWGRLTDELRLIPGKRNAAGEYLYAADLATEDLF